MKAVMYHYVRPDSVELPHFRHLHIDDFRSQLDFFEKHGGFVSQEEFLVAVRGDVSTPSFPEGFVLTFDDGLNDHVEYVLPELEARGLWALFYVATGVYGSNRLLNPHRVHMLLGMHGGSLIKRTLRENIHDDMISSQYVSEFESSTYQYQSDGEDAEWVKRTLNYFLKAEYQASCLDLLMETHIPDEASLVGDFYVTTEDITRLSRAGMIVGSHTVSHPLLSKLSREAQKSEIDRSFKFLESFIEPSTIKTFCFPYGGSVSYTDVTLDLLVEMGCMFSFDLAPRDIVRHDTATPLRRQTLPRYDCNMFPFGTVRALQTPKYTEK